MKGAGRARRLAITAAACVATAAGPAFGQAPTAPATEIAPVTVTAKKQPGKRWEPAKNPIPPELGAGTETCWQAAQDPSFEALLEAVVDLQVLPPTVYQPTRFPRNPDWSAPPVTPPGSPFPEALSINDYVVGKRGDPNRNLALAGKFLDCLDGANAPSMGRQMVTMAGAVEQQVRNATSNGMISVGGAGGMGLGADENRIAPNRFAQMNARDKTLPLGFALFDHGRYEEALTQFKAADRKMHNLEAPLMIGKIYLYGLGDKSDPAEGVKWLKKAADDAFRPAIDMAVFDPLEPERNTPMGEAAMILADVYGKGMGPIARDPALARKYLERAYRVGHVAAAMALGDIYYYGVDTAPDPKRAFDDYMKAAKFAYAPAAVAVAQMYEAGEVGGRPDRARALAWYAQAARTNHPQALYAMAVAFDRGEGVAANPKTALAFYKLAATQGEAAAQTAIGTYFYTGEGGLPKDAALARKWFELAATAGDPDGMFNLAAMMAKGEGGGVDRVKAWGWLKIAERAGHASAATAAAALEAQLTSQERTGVAELKRTG
jgi:TPR repeat protein